MGFIKLTGRKHNCLYSWLKNIKRELYSRARSFKERSEFYLRDFDANPPIIVYQMGKVGSSTVYRSLVNSYLKNPVYQVHFLSDEGIRNAEEYFLCLDLPIRVEHIERSKLLRKKMSKNRGGGGKLLLW